MSSRINQNSWVGLIVEGRSVIALAVRGRHARAEVTARREIDFNADDMAEGCREMRQFVAAHSLSGADAYILFQAAGTVVQAFNLPPMNSRNRSRAVKMRLTSHVGDSELTTNWLSWRRGARKDGWRILAAGVERRICEEVYLACLRAGLRVRSAMPLAAAFSCPDGLDRVVQLVMGVRNTTIQVFDQGRLHACRDTPIGRRDLLEAYTRPILSADGPITLSTAEADRMLRTVGVPIESDGDDAEVAPGVRSSQLWPILSPTLQKFRDEVRQTIEHSGIDYEGKWQVCTVSLPAVAGLAAYLAAELEMVEVEPETAGDPTRYLAGVRGQLVRGRELDLRPTDVRRAARLFRPAMVASVACALVLIAQLNQPRSANATISQLSPVSATLEQQAQRIERELRQLESQHAILISELDRRRSLLAAAPEPIPVATMLKALLSMTTDEMRIVEIKFHSVPSPATLECVLEFKTGAPAAVAAARWARRLSESAFFFDAAVTSLSGGGRKGSALASIAMKVRR